MQLYSSRHVCIKIIKSPMRIEGWMNGWKSWHVFPPSLELSNIIHNLIFYSNQIYWIEFLHPGVGLRPSMMIPYGTIVGADTMHPEFYHGSTCLIKSNRQSRWFQNIPQLIGCLLTFQPYGNVWLVIKRNNRLWSSETDMSVTNRKVKLISVTVFTETDETKIYPLYGISRIS